VSEKSGKSSLASRLTSKVIDRVAPYVVIDGVLTKCARTGDSVKIPEGVTEIGRGAIREMHTLMKQLYIPNSLGPGKWLYWIDYEDQYMWMNIPGERFVVPYDHPALWTVDGALLSRDGRKLYRVPRSVETYTIPSTVREICRKAFYECERLERIEIPSSVKVIGESAFFNCDALKEIVIQPGVERIEHNAFFGSGMLKEFVLPEGVRSMESTVFHTDRLVLPSTLEEIVCTAISVKQEIVVAEGNPHFMSRDGALFDKTGTRLIKAPEQYCIENLPAIVQVIGEKAFRYNKTLTDTVIPEGVVCIEAGAFSLTPVTQMKLPHSLTEIGEEAFAFCSDLKSVEMEDGVEKIGDGAFRYCKHMTALRLSASLREIPKQMCEECHDLEQIEIPPSVKIICTEAFLWVKKATFSEGLEVIEKDAFDGWRMGWIRLPAGLKSVSKESFSNANRAYYFPRGKYPRAWMERFGNYFEYDV